MNRLREIEERLSQIRTEINAEGADLNALSAEVDQLLEERASLMAAAESRSALLNRIGAGEIGTPQQRAAETEPQYNAASPEYRSAYIKNLYGADLSREERAAFVATTGNTTAPLPTQMLNEIWSMIEEEHAIMGDITVYRTGVAIEIVKHTEVVQGKAKKVAENAANDDEKNTFAKVTLSGNDFSKDVDLSYAMAKMSISAFEEYLKREIAAGIGDLMAADAVAQIGTDMASGNKIQTAASGVMTYGDAAAAFALLKHARNLCVYATRQTIYKYLVGMVDSTGRPIFQPNAQDGAEGTFIGAQVKVEDGVADGKFLIGDPKRVIYNMVQDIMLETDRDIKKHVITHSGYARGEGALIYDKAFAELSIKA